MRRWKGEIGKAVNCAVCGMRKVPRGRSAPLEMANGMCDWECKGYDQEPRVGDLWPGESREDFGFGANEPVKAIEPCPDCQGTGGYSPPCGSCFGTGELPTDEPMKVTASKEQG